MENKVILSDDAKQKYLMKLSKRLIKILYLIEEENKEKDQEEKKENPEEATDTTVAEGYILGQLFEVNSSNVLFDNALTDVVIKLNGILNYHNVPFTTIRKQVFEAKGIVDHLINKTK